MPKKPIYIQTRRGRMRKWVDLTEMRKASTEELRAWLWQNDPNGDYDGAQKEDMIFLIILQSEGSVRPGPKRGWPVWFEEVWQEEQD